MASVYFSIASLYFCSFTNALPSFLNFWACSFCSSVTSTLPISKLQWGHWMGTSDRTYCQGMLWTRDLKGLEDPWHPLALCWKPLPNIEKRHSNSLLDLEWSFLTQFRLEGISKLFRVSNRDKLENTSSSPQIPTYDQGSMDRSDLVHGSLDITEIAGLQTFLKQPTVFYYSTFSSSKIK